MSQAPVTPDGRYFVVRGRLWRCSNPSLSAEDRSLWVHRLMQARSAKGRAMRAGDAAARETARRAVDEAKHALGERGKPWWTDGAPDYNRHLVHNTPYKEWFEGLEPDGQSLRIDKYLPSRKKVSATAQGLPTS